ncbi:hypothetical protein IQ255_17915 [Pleurocapsales cyanobacterium LEGE 10410]|nr:hypothetical protein [Pleurocapsales cyanobacterium LEGE 10410]
MEKLNVRYVIYNNHDGLANRLRLHCLAHAYALKTKRKLVIDWKRNVYCYATYHDLFVGGSSSLTMLSPWERGYFRFAERFNRYSFDPNTLSDGDGVESLVDLPHRVVDVSNLEASVERGSRLGPYHQEVLKSLIPRPEIQEKVNQFLDRFQSPTVGIHLRLGDFVNKYGTALPPVKRYVAIIQKITQFIPDAVFILASDGDEETLKPLLSAGKCKVRPKVNLRQSLEGMQDALTDLLVLSATDLVVSTPNSSFGGFAATLGNKPIVRATEDWERTLNKAINQNLISTRLDFPKLAKRV